MPRMPEITQRDQVDDDAKPHFDSIIASRGRIGAPYQYLLHSPDQAARVAHTIGFARFEATLDRRVSPAMSAALFGSPCCFVWRRRVVLRRGQASGKRRCRWTLSSAKADTVQAAACRACPDSMRRPARRNGSPTGAS